jgi:hypothetical protein
MIVICDVDSFEISASRSVHVTPLRKERLETETEAKVMISINANGTTLLWSVDCKRGNLVGKIAFGAGDARFKSHHADVAAPATCGLL